MDACADISTKKQLAFLMARQGVLPNYEEEAEEMQEGSQVRCCALPHACYEFQNQRVAGLLLHACSAASVWAPGPLAQACLPAWGEAPVCSALQQC